MGSVLITKTSFVSGELDPALLGRLDLKAQGDGAARLRNVLVQPTGGVTRRPGLARVASPPGALRLLSFEAAFGPALVAIRPERIDLVRDSTVLEGPQSLWSAAQLGNLAWARLGNQLLLTHPEVSAPDPGRDGGRRVHAPGLELRDRHRRRRDRAHLPALRPLR